MGWRSQNPSASPCFRALWGQVLCSGTEMEEPCVGGGGGGGRSWHGDPPTQVPTPPMGALNRQQARLNALMTQQSPAQLRLYITHHSGVSWPGRDHAELSTAENVRNSLQQDTARLRPHTTRHSSGTARLRTDATRRSSGTLGPHATHRSSDTAQLRPCAAQHSSDPPHPDPSVPAEPMRTTPTQPRM